MKRKCCGTDKGAAPHAPGCRQGNAPSQDSSMQPNWKVKCCACGQKPTVGDLELCGPCCFGEADTAGGNW